jgi:hypothetical protein
METDRAKETGKQHNLKLSGNLSTFRAYITNLCVVRWKVWWAVEVGRLEGEAS